MFKEITKKLYGEEAGSGVEFPAAELEEELRPEEHITAWGLAALMQHGVPPPGILQANFTPRTDPAAEDRWSAPDEPLAWAQSRVASYNPAQRLFKCADCECVGFLSRVAEHWLGTHSQARAFHCPLPHCGYSSGWARCVRGHLARDHRQDPAAAEPLLRDNPALDDVTRYLQRLKARVDARRGQPAQPAAPPPAPLPAPAAAVAAAGQLSPADLEPPGAKRYVCRACPYATDRRDLFTRHENIHRDDKPFHCYLCHKQFNRADHVKKHFLRMHRDHPYDLHRIRRPGKPPPPPAAPAPPPPTTLYKPPPVPTAPPSAPVYKVSERAPLARSEPAQRAAAIVQSGAGGAGSTVPRRAKGERRYACCYCAWSGADNWCLKRHLNTHLKPFACALCEYKAARAERLATHVSKVHNKRACGRCSFLADDAAALAAHLRTAHLQDARTIRVPAAAPRPAAPHTAAPAYSTQPAPAPTVGHSETAAAVASISSGAATARRRAGAARLFGYLEASDGEPEPEPEQQQFAQYEPAPGPAPPPTGPAAPPDKENAIPHALHHEHCLRY